MGSEGDTASNEFVTGEETGGGDEIEWKKVNLMRVFVESQDPLAKEVDNFTIRRFLRARELDIEKASAMFLKYLKWRRDAIPKGFISDQEVQNDLRQEKLYFQGFDKKGRPIAEHYSSRRNMDEFKRYVVYLLEKFGARVIVISGFGEKPNPLDPDPLESNFQDMPRGQETFVCIADLQGWGYYANCDIRAYLASLEILQNYYPERLGKAFLIHVPYIFMKVWKIIYPFIDENTRKKFVFVEDKDLKSTLLEEIDESQLPEIYGGKLPLVPVDAAGSCTIEA